MIWGEVAMPGYGLYDRALGACYLQGLWEAIDKNAKRVKNEINIKRLKEKEQWEKAGVALPAYDIAAVAEETKKSPVWVHFGAGNIFRIFIGGIADTLIANGEASKGITCVETFDFDVVDKIYAPMTIWFWPLP